MKSLSLLPIVALGLGACTNNGADYTPVLDGPQTATYQADLQSCQHLARSQRKFDQDNVEAIAVGTGIGAVLGEVDSDGDPVGGAIAGALAGGTASVVNATRERKGMVIECLQQRGYRVVG